MVNYRTASKRMEKNLEVAFPVVLSQEAKKKVILIMVTIT